MQTVPLNCSNPAPRHGKLGLASFFIAIFAAILCAGGFLLAGIGANSAAERGEEMPRAMAMVAGSMILGACFIAFIGFCLGVAGLFQKNTKKVFAIVGVVLPTLEGLAFGAFMIIGLMVASSRAKSCVHEESSGTVMAEPSGESLEDDATAPEEE